MGLLTWIRRRKLGAFAAEKQAARARAMIAGRPRVLRAQHVKIEIDFELEPPKSNREQPRVYFYPFGDGVRYEVRDENLARLARAALKAMQQEATRLLKR